MKQFFADHPELVPWLITALCSLLGVGGIGGGMWHHHYKYHGHDHDRPAVEQSQKYKMSDDETRLKIQQDMEEKECIKKSKIDLRPTITQQILDSVMGNENKQGHK